MSAEPMSVFGARMKVRDAAMDLARRGLSADTIREYLHDLAEQEAARAIAWAAEEDRRMELADREEFAESYARDAETEECA